MKQTISDDQDWQLELQQGNRAEKGDNPIMYLNISYLYFY